MLWLDVYQFYVMVSKKMLSDAKFSAGAKRGMRGYAVD